MVAKVAKTRFETTPAESVLPKVFSMLFGVFIAVSLLKFGNPCVFDEFVSWPEGGFEWILNQWPVKIGYWMLGGLVVLGLFVVRWRMPEPRWLLLAPLFWLAWQFVCAVNTINAELTRLTLPHFTACVVCFYLGVFCMNQVRSPSLFWLPVLCAFVVVILWGLHQRFGGLEETRTYFFTYIYPQMKSLPPEYMKKISSDRIFSTLFYPNALAGALLLLLPASLAVVWQCSTRFTFAARCFLVGCLATAALACLYWSGSKGGWLLALLMSLIGLLQLKFGARLKLALIVLVVVGGVTGFAVKYATFFKRGATSVIARFDYWRAAGQTAVSNPFFGTGPGTFGDSYKKIKQPESEMARLAHNDYVEQASDSGIPGCLAYVIWIIGALCSGYRKPDSPDSLLRYCTWLGAFGLATQGLVEFGLYIPALAWVMFTLLGLLIADLGGERTRA